MFSFEGNYKRTPIQNLGGVSHTNDRETLIRRAQHERQKRAEVRKRQTGAVVIQSYIRSFLTRCKRKAEVRFAFDQYLQSAGLLNEQHLEYLLKRILFFYHKSDQKDGERLVKCFSDHKRTHNYHFSMTFRSSFVNSSYETRTVCWNMPWSMLSGSIESRNCCCCAYNNSLSRI